MEYSLIPKLGSDLLPEEIAACVKVIREGSAVDPTTAAQELPYAVAVAIVCAGEHIVGVGAIKRSRPDYAKRIASAAKSAFAFDPQMNELGYVAVLPAHRGGRSGPIMNSLLERFSGPLWATTSEDLMKHSLGNRGFVQKGKEWPSTKGNRLSLWIKCAQPNRVT